MTRLFVTLCAIAALSGCTVPVVGSAGIGVDQEGRPVGYLAVCDEHIDGATLYSEDPAAASAEERSVDGVGDGQWGPPARDDARPSPVPIRLRREGRPGRVHHGVGPRVPIIRMQLMSYRKAA